MVQRRHTRRASPDGDDWGAVDHIMREPGFDVVAAGAWCSDPAGDTSVVFEGTCVHPSAPASAWTPLWTATLTTSDPAASAPGALYIGHCRWLRWRLTTSTAPTDGSVVHLVVDGDHT